MARTQIACFLGSSQPQLGHLEGLPQPSSTSQQEGFGGMTSPVLLAAVPLCPHSVKWDMKKLTVPQHQDKGVSARRCFYVQGGGDATRQKDDDSWHSAGAFTCSAVTGKKYQCVIAEKQIRARALPGMLPTAGS